VLRLFATVLALVGLSASVTAQEKGSVVLDAMTTPGRHVGVGFYITDGLSLRPSLGFGYDGQFGTTFNLGADLRWEVRAGNRVSPYLTAGFNYVRSPYVVQYDSGGSPTFDSNVARYGAGLGLRTRIKYGLSAVAEGRVMNSELRSLSGSYGQQGVQSGAHFQGILGLSYAFN
jgi:opacity protein-like surface antigen